MGTPENVRVLAGGGIYIAPVGTTLPTDATSSLDPAFQELGCINEDGLSETPNRSLTDIFCGFDGDLVRRISSQFDITMGFTLIETNPRTLSLYHGNYSDSTGAGTVNINGDDLPHYALVIQVLDGDDKIRIVAGDAQVTEQGEITYQTQDAIGYPVTLTMYPNSSQSGNNAVKYIDYGTASS